MKKIKCFYFFVLIIIFILFSTSVLAVKGCFLDEESELFCQELTKISAEQECNNQEDCSIEKDYAYGQNCEEFEACEKILCKSSCKEEFRGKCSYGEVQKGEEQQWCNSGCCKFFHLRGDYCEIADNKWLCQIEASNKNVNQIDWDTNINNLECKSACSETLNLEGFILEEIDLEKLNTVELETEKLVKNIEKANTVVSNKDNDSENITKSFFLIFLMMFIIFLLHFGKNFHLKRSKQINKKENIDYKLSKDGERENKMSKNNIFNFLISSNKKLKLLIKKRKIKRKEFHLDESFGKFSKNKHIRTNLEKLNDTIKHHRRRNKKKRGKEIKSILKKMNSFNSNKILNQKVGKSQGDTTNKKLNVIERIKAIEDLKLIKSKNKRKKI